MIRGLAFFMMAYDHAMYDLNDILNVSVPTVGLIGDISAVLYMLLCGVSASLSRNPFRHGLRIFSVGCGLTVITGLADVFFHMGLTIQFGILHLLGIALIVCAGVRLLHPAWNGIIAIFFLFFQKATSSFFHPKCYWLFPFGYYTAGFYSSDYYPIFPYVGVVLCGLLLGRLVYRNRRSLLPHSIGGTDVFSFIGRHSLAFYVLHQPPLLAILWLTVTVLRHFGLISD